MDKKENKSIISIIILVVVVLGAIWYFKVGYLLRKPEMPEANIEIQTQMVDGGTINLRNVDYTEGQIKVGYEVKGFSLKEYNISCKLYNGGNLISTSGSTGGGLIELDEKHYYLIGDENINQINLPESVNLTVEIAVIPNDFRQKPITASFNVSLDKEVQ
ncbi:hypothetical protein [Paenibacillus xylanivorans]|uniref:DUF4352 domain-containing protein n=1 Tax=Paenibacillus xylanivorans TaxID=1705561 RepID=A0A0N0UI03_9BACL|nr:hypothetical protein [Paenibacillus xylanivorans]KOY16777.1 hypothetical protein AMS66_07795 [Paenibacillus xylanivorans]